jgi:hypothetical protein
MICIFLSRAAGEVAIRILSLDNQCSVHGHAPHVRYKCGDITVMPDWKSVEYRCARRDDQGWVAT